MTTELTAKEILFNDIKNYGHWSVSEKRSGYFPSIYITKDKSYTGNRYIINESATRETGTHQSYAECICNAINSTYGKGLDPEKMEEIVLFLEDIDKTNGDSEEILNLNVYSRAIELLHSARIK